MCWRAQVLDASANWKAAPCIRRFARDVKEYMMRCAALGGARARARACVRACVQSAQIGELGGSDAAAAPL
jgi:hypothetical protein